MTPEVKSVVFQVNGEDVTREIETFNWEKLDYVEKIKQAFAL